MRQTIGIRFSEHGQIHICSYHIPDEGPLLTAATGIMTNGEHGLTFGRVVWQHLESTESELRKTKEAAEQAEAPAGLSLFAASSLAASSDDGEDTAENMPEETPKNATADASDAQGAENAKSVDSAGVAMSGNSRVTTSRMETTDQANHAKSYVESGVEPDPNVSQDMVDDLGYDQADDTASDKKEGRRPIAKPMPELRTATEAELVVAMENERINREARHYCRRCIGERNLDMKLVDVETLYDRSKMIFYFTAPTRIDFRELVKDLVRQYRTRIELRQIGVRHETQMVGALGNCGMVCCCRRYLRKFAPVTIKMAKEQNLFLNPAKISGICGRLLCCLSYEQENYDSFHRSCPRLGKRYQTLNGPMRVLRGNMFRNSVVVLPDGGQELEVTLEEWKRLNPQRSESTARDGFGDDVNAPSSHGLANSPDGLNAELNDQDEDVPLGHGGAKRDSRRPSRPGAPARHAPRHGSKEDARKDFSSHSDKNGASKNSAAPTPLSGPGDDD